MRSFILVLAIAVAGQSHAQTMPAEVLSNYPAPGVFCGVMTLCTPKATAPAPAAPVAEARQ